MHKSFKMAERVVEVEGIAYYTIYEKPSNPSPNHAPLVFLSHALMANHHMYDESVKALLSAGYRTLRYDHIGHNKTPAPKSYSSSLEKPAYHFDDFTRHMRKILVAVTGSSKIHAIVGCSMGGVLTLRYLMMYPGDVKYAVSIGAPGMTSPEAAKPLWTQRIEQLEKDLKDGGDLLYQATAERWLPGDEERSKKARALALEETKTCSLNGYKICADAIRTYDYTSQLGKIRGTKCMVLAGSRDTAVGPKEVLQNVAKSIHGAEYVWLEGAGHLPPIHLPDEFNKILLDFIQRGKPDQVVDQTEYMTDQAS